MRSRLQKRLDIQDTEEAHEREKAALEKDATTHVLNHLLIQIAVLRRAQTRGSDMEEFRTHRLQPHVMDIACTGGSRRCHKPASPRCKDRSDQSKPHKPMKTCCIVDLVEIIRKQIDEDKPQPRGDPGSSIMWISDSPLSGEITPTGSQEVRDIEIRLLYWSDWPRPAPLSLSGQDGVIT